MIGDTNMTYLVIHLLSATISILLQMNDGGCEGNLALLYVLTGPLGLVAKLLSKII